MNEHFAVARLWWLLRADLAGGRRSLVTISLTLAGIILIAALLFFDPSDSGQDFYTAWYRLMLLVWGLIASSQAFVELHDKNRNHAYLLIPAAALEKTVARLLTVTLGIVIYLLLFTSVVSLLVAGLLGLFTGGGYGLFNPLDPRLLPLIGWYFFLQSFYFLGAAWFRRGHFVKTALATVLIAIALIVATALAFGVALAPDNAEELAELVVGMSVSSPGVFRPLATLGKTLVVLLPVACWTIAWLRLREAEVSHGV